MITEKIKNIFFSIKNRINDEMKSYDLTVVQVILLEYLYENKNNNIIQKDICEHLSLKHSTIISVLKRLEEKGLITKETNYWSKIAITKQGIEQIEKMGIKKGFFENRLLAGFNEEEIRTLSKYLDRISSNINN